MTPTLQWSSAAGATSYDVYFGTPLDPPFVANTTSTSWSPGRLNGNQGYWWSVTAKNSFIETASEFQYAFVTRITTPMLEAVSPPVGVPSSTSQVTITGTNLGSANSVRFSGDGIEATIVPIGRTETSLPVAITVDPDAQVGWRTVTVTNVDGNSEPFDGFLVQNERQDQEFTVDLEAGYYTAEITLFATTTPITVPAGQTIEAEIAVTREEQARGLVDRPNFAPLAGMLYVNANDDIFAHSTKGMSSPLDIVWIDNSRKVTFVSPNAPPCPVTETQCPLYEGSTPARYVLEINAGQAAALGIQEGVQLGFEIPAQLIGKKAGYWGMEVLTADRVLSGGFNLGGGYNSESGPGFGAFLIEEDQTVEMTANAQPLRKQLPPVIDMTLLDADRNAVDEVRGVRNLFFPFEDEASVALSNPLLSASYTVTLASQSGKGTFQLALSADHFSAGVVVGGYIENGIVGFAGFNLPRPTQATIRLYNSAYGTAASGRVQLQLKDSLGGTVATTRVK